MSLILEALRKSEAERRRGQAPDLHSPAPLLARRAPPSRSPWPLVTAAIALAALGSVAWWWSTTRNSSAAPPSLVDSASVAEVENVAPRVATAVTPAPAPRAAPSVIAAPPPVPATSAVTAAAAASSPQASIPIPKPAAVSPPLTRPAMDPPAPATVEQALPSLAALSTAQRATLPPMRMSMHVWADAPRDRFAIVDGQRVGEGARLAGAVVAQIRSDGLVLDIDGQLYLLPRP